jgi:hypothetical protein
MARFIGKDLEENRQILGDYFVALGNRIMNGEASEAEEARASAFYLNEGNDGSSRMDPATLAAFAMYVEQR